MKKMISLVLVLVLMMFFIPAPTVFANEMALLPAFNVLFNGQTVESNYRQFPLLVYKDITYVPMTYYDCRFLGLTTKWDNDARTLYIEQSPISCAYRDYKWQWENSKNNEGYVCDFNIVVNGKTIDNSKEEYPLLTFRDVTYFPLTWHFAVDEFGWEYLFDSKNGLSINSANKHTEVVNLPNIAGSVATDGKYYYYNGNDGDKHVVYRASVEDTKKPEVIFEYPDSGMMRRVNFVESKGDIYFYYILGSSPVMSRRYVKKIQLDGTVTDEKPAFYSYSAHGYSECCVRSDKIEFNAVNPYFDSATELSYTIDDVITKVEPFSGRVRIGQRRNGKSNNSSLIENFVKIYNEKIYFTALDLDTDHDSALYVIDTKKGTAEKIIDGVCGFYVYEGWIDELSQVGTMIIYDNNGTLMRYTQLNGDIRKIEEDSQQPLVLMEATGGQNIFTVQRTIDGKKTVVKAFDCYASGTGSIKETVFETNTGTNSIISDNMLCVYTIGESYDDDVRIVVPHLYYSSDAPESLFIYKDTLIYKLYDNTVVKVDLE